MKKYIKSSQSDGYEEFSNAVGQIVDKIHSMTNWDSEDRDIYLSSPSSFVDDTIPKIQKLLQEAQAAYVAYHSNLQ